ncbi:DUF2804 family protein [Aeromicrobium sp. UC242_57]|uniref:DUF2804 family protein n=1 Tax=Aeromicrobium sp. UC242_57 TaxID=3374624 RepID=UPI003789CBE9
MSPTPIAVHEREITAPVSLTLPDGRLNPAAVGWTRTPLITTDGVGAGRRGKGRNKRWEYWAVTTPTHVVALVVSSLDYAAVHSIWLLDRTTGETIAHDAIGLLGGSASLPGTLGAGPVRSRTKQVTVDIDEVDGELGCAHTARGSGSTSWPTGQRGMSAWVSWCPGPTGCSSTPSRTSPDPQRARSGSMAWPSR